MASLETSMGTAHKIEEATKEQSSCAEWHQPRRPAFDPESKIDVVFVDEDGQGEGAI